MLQDPAKESVLVSAVESGRIQCNGGKKRLDAPWRGCGHDIGAYLFSVAIPEKWVLLKHVIISPPSFYEYMLGACFIWENPWKTPCFSGNSLIYLLVLIVLGMAMPTRVGQPRVEHQARIGACHSAGGDQGDLVDAREGARDGDGQRVMCFCCS